MQHAKHNDIDHQTPQQAETRCLARLMTRFDNARRKLDQQATLRTADMRLLWLFHDGVYRTLRQIAEQLGLEQSTVNRQVNTAVKEGLLLKHRDTPNEPYRFRRSPTGDRKFEQTLQVTLGKYQQALESLGLEGELFLELMERYVEAYYQAVH